MPDQYNHGVRVIEGRSGGRRIRTIATAIIGLVATGPAADAAYFPANTCVVVTDIDAAIAKAGDTGTLKASLTAIGNQVKTILVICRAVPGAAPATLDEAVVAAVKSLRTAEASTGYRPRIIGAPGLDTEVVTTEIALTAAKLRAFAYASTNGATTLAAVTTYRNKFSARELMLIQGNWTAAATDGSTVSVSAVATAMGLRAQTDKTIGWHKTISNLPVAGVTGIANPLFFDLQDSDTEVGAMNAIGVTCLVNFDGAFRFWGSRTCAPGDSDFYFESATRTAQILADTNARGLAWAVAQPIHPSLARDMLGMINKEIRRLVRAGRLIGGESYLADGNTAEVISSGGLGLAYDFTPCPPLEDLVLYQNITDRYLDDFAAQVAAA